MAELSRPVLPADPPPAVRPPAVIGVGSTFRHDDGIGPAVVRALGRMAAPAGLEGVELLEAGGEAARLIDAWEGRSRVVVVDAMRTGAEAAAIARVDVGRDPLPPWTRGGGTHTFGVADAIDLARVLDRLPRRLVLIGVEGVDFSDGEGLSVEVARRLPTIAALVASEVQNEGSAPCASMPSVR